VDPTGPNWTQLDPTGPNWTHCDPLRTPDSRRWRFSRRGGKFASVTEPKKKKPDPKKERPISFEGENLKPEDFRPIPQSAMGKALRVSVFIPPPKK